MVAINWPPTTEFYFVSVCGASVNELCFANGSLWLLSIRRVLWHAFVSFYCTIYSVILWYLLNVEMQTQYSDQRKWIWLTSFKVSKVAFVAQALQLNKISAFGTCGALLAGLSIETRVVCDLKRFPAGQMWMRKIGVLGHPSLTAKCLKNATQPLL